MYTNTINLDTVIHPISRNRGIAIFRTGEGGRFIKVKNEKDDWRAITLLTYRGPGLVVFLNDVSEFEHTQKIGTGEILKSQYRVKISAVYEKHATGIVVDAAFKSRENGTKENENFKPLTYDPGAERADSSNDPSFEDLFSALCDKVDADYDDDAPLRNVGFEGTSYSPDECATILKIQNALYKVIDSEDRVNSID